MESKIVVKNSTLVDRIEPWLRGYTVFNQHAAVFDFGNVVVLKNYQENNGVRVISGGTSNHSEFVGKGMLTAVVQGSKNMAPTSELILRTIRELSVNHFGGILVTVQGSPADLLNFGLAVERALNDDLQVMFLGVIEDIENKKFSKAQRRGLSGIVLVNKIAGSLTDNEQDLSNVYKYCKKVIDHTVSVGFNISQMIQKDKECTICKKCISSSHFLKNYNTAVDILDLIPDLIRDTFKEIQKNENIALKSGDSLVILVNNSGALAQTEEYIFIKEILEYLQSCELEVARFYVGSYLKFNYDIDLSITVLKLFDTEILKYLDAPCNAPGWKPVYQDKRALSLNNIVPGCLKRKCRLSPPIKGPKLGDRATNILHMCLQFACNALISCEHQLNRIDSEKGDGDTGTRLKNVAEVLNLRSCNKKLVMDYPFTFFLCLSKLLGNAVKGIMGCIYSVMFEAAANKFGEYKEEDEVVPEMWLEALENACDAVKRYGNVDIGDNTMYDPLKVCAVTVRQKFDDTKYFGAFGEGVSKAEETAKRTKTPGFRYPDAGAHAVGIWMRAVYEGVKLRCDF